MCLYLWYIVNVFLDIKFMFIIIIHYYLCTAIFCLWRYCVLRYIFRFRQKCLYDQ